MSFRDAHFDGPGAPLPGTGPQKRALFIDRFGTLLELHEGKPRTIYKEIKFQEGVLDALFRCVQSGWMIYLIGNESTVAGGQRSQADWEKFQTKLLAEMHKQGVDVAHCYACLTDPETGKGKAQVDSVFLLPNTGAMYHARQHDDIVLETSWVIGDSAVELAAGWRAGCRTAGIDSGEELSQPKLQTNPEFVSDSLVEALDQILQEAAASKA
jgi:D-glycero-D-manno-heptose 1,7-bisphosphate phosphatase